MSERPDLGYINLRGCSKDRDFVTAVSSVLGQDLPVDANTMTIENHRVFWLGPDEWLIVTAYDNIGGLIERLRISQDRQHVAVTDVSGGNILIRLAGDNVRDVLAKGCTLDFHSDVFPVGRCAQSGLAKTNVLIGHIDSGVGYEILVRRSFSDYLTLWLQSAGAEYGGSFTVT